MNAETLERLLLDRALGALSPEVESLLAAHLERDAEAAARARQFAEATLLARRALGGGPAAELPPFPSVRIEKLRRARRNLVLVRNIAGLAAMLVLGIGVGGGLSRHFAAAKSAVPPTPIVYLVDGPAPRIASVSDGFWSGRRLLAQAQRLRVPSAQQMIWDSPVERPRLGDVQ